MKPVLVEKPIEIARDHYLLRITGLPEPSAGQFVNIKIGKGTDPLLRRPFSVFNYSEGTTEIVIKIAGKGTSLLKVSEPGEIDAIGPLGMGFSVLKTGSALLAGGGVGNAPLYYLAKKLKESGTGVKFVYGARSSEYIYLLEEFKKVSDDLTVTTDDGSSGKKGLAAEEALAAGGADIIYTCGPAGMMRAISDGSSAPVEASMENYFGCGIGICSGCTIRTVGGLKRACVDGPVMEGKKIIWEELCR
ncbi:MAG: dihydroorotate dehydrogenase electron transfer subunit [Spirochaetes bacterium]|jgi:dihydroorotate dehydrogenase electron transfer subunit|nr:dihydroorotate dehydrogenase electron transfer subunit [Spirochaetota bacterium]